MLKPLKCFGYFWLSLGFLGFVPMIPGTAASVVSGLLILSARPVLPPLELKTYIILAAVFLSVFAFSVVLINLCITDGQYDKNFIVIDEFLGMMVTLLPVFIFPDIPWYLLVLSFILFRFFDILKPAGIRYFDNKNSSVMVIVDDLVAGLYSALLIGGIAALLMLS